MRQRGDDARRIEGSGPFRSSTRLLIESVSRLAIISVSALKAAPDLVPRLDDVGQLNEQFAELGKQQHGGTEGGENGEHYVVPVHANAPDE